MTTELQTSPERGLDLSYTVQVFPAPLYLSREGSGALSYTIQVFTAPLYLSREGSGSLSYTVQVVYFSREGSGLGNLQNVYTIKKFASAQKHINRSENYRSPH